MHVYGRLFTKDHLSSYNTDACFLSAFGTEQRKVDQYRIGAYFCAGFALAYRTQDPVCFCFLVLHPAGPLNAWLSGKYLALGLETAEISFPQRGPRFPESADWGAQADRRTWSRREATRRNPGRPC